MNGKNLSLTIFLLLLTSLTSWLVYKNVFQNQQKIATQNNKPDAIAERVTALNFEKAGSMKSSLTATKLTHFSENNSTDIIKPKLTLYHPPQNPWIITADRGKALNGTSVITLSGNVVLHQPAGKNNEDITITTDSLNFNSQEKMAETKALVTLIEKTNADATIKLTSQGARVFQQTGVVQLLANARGLYEPKH